MKNNSLVSKEYSIAATEILDILNYLPTDIVKKVPSKLVEFFKVVSVEDYKPQFDYSQGLENVKLKEKSRALLAMIYRNYLCYEEERKEFDQILFQNEEQFQKQLREKYNPENLFQNKIENEKEENNQNTALIEYRERKWYHKIFQKIRQVFLKSN